MSFLDDLFRGAGGGDVTGPASSVIDRLVLMAATTGKVIKQSAIGVADVLLRTGAVAMTGDLDFGTHKGINAATPTISTDLATKAYVDAHSGGGSGRGFSFTYAGSGTIGDADPGVGIFRGNNATLASSTQLFIDDVAANGATGMAAWIASFDDQVGAVKGVLRLQSASDPTKFIEWPVTAITTAGGYSKVTLGAGWGPGGITTTASDTLLSFDATGVSSNLNNQELINAKGYGYNGEIGTTGATPAVNFTTGDLQLTTLSTNATPTFTAPSSVRWVQWCVIQDSTPRTITFPGSVVGTPPQPNTVSGSRTFYGFFYDGTSYHYSTHVPFVNADIAAAAAIAGSKISPIFGAQLVTSSTGFAAGSSPYSAGAYRMGNNDYLTAQTTLAVGVSLIGISNGDTVGVGDANAPIVVAGSSSVSLRVGASTVAQALSTSFRLLTPNLNFDSAQVSPVITQSVDASATVTCDDLLVQAQSGSGATAVNAGNLVLKGGSCTGGAGTRNGGACVLQGGLGATQDGSAIMRSAGGTNRVEANSTGLGFFAVTPVARPNLTGSRASGAALVSLIAAGVSLGLWTDGTSA